MNIRDVILPRAVFFVAVFVMFAIGGLCIRDSLTPASL